LPKKQHAKVEAKKLKVKNQSAGPDKKIPDYRLLTVSKKQRVSFLASIID